MNAKTESHQKTRMEWMPSIPAANFCLEAISGSSGSAVTNPHPRTIDGLALCLTKWIGGRWLHSIGQVQIMANFMAGSREAWQT